MFKFTIPDDAVERATKMLAMFGIPYTAENGADAKPYFSLKKYCVDKFGSYTEELVSVLDTHPSYKWLFDCDGKRVVRIAPDVPALIEGTMVASFPEWEEIR